MKVLLDTCLSPKAKTELQSAGHDVIWAGDWSVDPGDEVILRRAWEDRRVLVTLDKDFGELGLLREMPHCGLIRLVNFRAAQQGRVCLQILAGHPTDLGDGATITAEPGRIRIRHGKRPRA